MGQIPSYAKKVFEGVIFEVHQWDQEMFDGSKEIFEMLKRPDTVQIIATQGDKILTTKESQPMRPNFRGLIGGRVDKGETPQETAIRELQEEAGMVCKDWSLWKSFRPELKIDWEVFFFIAKDCERTAGQTLDPGEKIELCPLSFDEFIELTLSENFWCRDLTLAVLKMLHDNTIKDFRRLLFK